MIWFGRYKTSDLLQNVWFPQPRLGNCLEGDFGYHIFYSSKRNGEITIEIEFTVIAYAI